jgi:hypothetical protein
MTNVDKTVQGSLGERRAGVGPSLAQLLANHRHGCLTSQVPYQAGPHENIPPHLESSEMELEEPCWGCTEFSRGLPRQNLLGLRQVEETASW